MLEYSPDFELTKTTNTLLSQTSYGYCEHFRFMTGLSSEIQSNRLSLSSVNVTHLNVIHLET